MAEAAPRDPWLLTPGPLTTAESTKRAMLHDWGSRDSAFFPGKLTVADSFRVGCIGRLGEAEMHGALGAMRLTLQEMGVTDCGPVAVAGRTA